MRNLEVWLIDSKVAIEQYVNVYGAVGIMAAHRLVLAAQLPLYKLRKL